MTVASLRRLLIAVGIATPSLAHAADVVTHHNNNFRTGANTQETILNTANVNPLSFGRLFTLPVDGWVQAQPLYVSNLAVSGATRNVVFVATHHNSVYAFDADQYSPQQGALWHRSLEPAIPMYDPDDPASRTDCNISPNPKWGDVQREAGIMSTPVIDVAAKTIFVVTTTKDPGYTECVNPEIPNATGPHYHHYLHALNLTDGADRMAPLDISVAIRQTNCPSCSAFFSNRQNQRPGLTLANGRIYIAFSGYGDQKPNTGWMIAFGTAGCTLPAPNACQVTGPPLVFTTTALRPTVSPNGARNFAPDGGGIWQGGRGPAVDSAGNLYVMTSNASCNEADPSLFPWTDPHVCDAESAGPGHLQEAFIKLPPNLQLPADDNGSWFQPHNFRSLDVADADLGSAGPLILPGTHYLVGGGKESKLYLLNTAHLGGFTDRTALCTETTVPSLVNDACDYNIRQSWYATDEPTLMPWIRFQTQGSPVYWNRPAGAGLPGGPTIYVWPTQQHLRAYVYDPITETFNTTPVSRSRDKSPIGEPQIYSQRFPGGILSISGNGGGDPANPGVPESGIVWAQIPVSENAHGQVAQGMLRAFDAQDLSRELWNSEMNRTRDRLGLFGKYAPPTIANGKVYVATFSGAVQVYGLNAPSRMVARQSSGLAGCPAGSCQANNAIDGNPNGAFYGGSLIHTDLDDNSWWEVDLGSVQPVDRLDIWNRTDCCADRLHGFYVFASTTPFDNATFGDLSTRPTSRFFARRYISTISDNPAAVPVRFNARYVRIQLDHRDYLALAEVQIRTRNLALDGKASESSTLASSPWKAIDGNTGGDWTTELEPTTHTTNTGVCPFDRTPYPCAGGPWWELDLGASLAVGQIDVWNRTDSPWGDRLHDFHIFLGLPAMWWAPSSPFGPNQRPEDLLQPPTLYSISAHAHVPGIGGSPTSYQPNQMGRYVRVQLSQPDYLTLAEVQVWPEAGNVAQGKGATQSSDLDLVNFPYAAASAAVDGGVGPDGKPTGQFASHSVTHTGLDANPWWEVNLGTSADIDHVNIWNRTDCCGERLHDFWVFIAQHPFKDSAQAPLQTVESVLAWKEANQDIDAYHVVGTVGTMMQVMTQSTGSYVRIQLDHADYLSLGEVQVVVR